MRSLRRTKKTVQSSPRKFLCLIRISQRTGTEESTELKKELPLGEGVLTVNLRVPLVILCTKSDVILSNEKGLYSDKSLEALYRSIRTMALSCI